MCEEITEDCECREINYAEVDDWGEGQVVQELDELAVVLVQHLTGCLFAFHWVFGILCIFLYYFLTLNISNILHFFYSPNKTPYPPPPKQPILTPKKSSPQ
jgi:hypothetical protein